MSRGVMIGRGVARSAGQVAVSVIATLIATQIYGALKHEATPAAEASHAAVPLTEGGKYETRIAGAAMPPLPESARPALSIVAWSITPPHPLSQVPDVGWAALDEDVARPAAPGPAPTPARREPRRPTVAAASVALPPSRPVLTAVAAPAAEPHPAAPASPGRPGLWSAATTAAASTVRGVAALGGSVVSTGTSVLGHLIP